MAVNSLNHKIHDIESMPESPHQPVIILFPDVVSIVPDGFSFSAVDSIVVVTSAFGPSAAARKLNATVDGLAAKFPDARISVFQCGRIIPTDADLTEGTNRGWKETILDDTYRIVSQFLPTKYREIEPRHLAQAIRLNYETCERMLSFVSIGINP